MTPSYPHRAPFLPRQETLILNPQFVQLATPILSSLHHRFNPSNVTIATTGIIHPVPASHPMSLLNMLTRTPPGSVITAVGYLISNRHSPCYAVGGKFVTKICSPPSPLLRKQSPPGDPTCSSYRTGLLVRLLSQRLLVWLTHGRSQQGLRKYPSTLSC